MLRRSDSKDHRVRRRAPATPPSPHHHDAPRPPDGHQKCDYELSLPQERVKYVVIGNLEAVVGTSTAFYDLVHVLPRSKFKYTVRVPRAVAEKYNHKQEVAVHQLLVPTV